ncbi:LysM peptidoglycan-binding domain-containing protein [Flavobacterium sp.]|uniref:LysM peptidoglycan-binding domain-containing protein n=1 Tax=Flavobacterium sp. TaxID=239 RepID=UPI0026369561|nr:LysM peptidoglycan-binding domain-containing protein [Flavobacterium sp.]
MKKMLLALIAMGMMSFSFGQNRKKDQEVDIIDHQVQLGESIRMISKKYLVDPSEIYKLNKFAVEGISQGMVLKIPVPRKEGAPAKEVASASNEDIAVNQSGSSTSQEVVAVDKPSKAYPEKTETVKTQPVQENPTSIPSPASTPKNDIKKIVITERKTEVNHKVVAKETLYSLARDFNVSVEDIKANNAEVLKNGLQIGQIIKIPTEKSIDIKQSTSVTDETPKSEKPSRTTTETKPVVVQKNTTETADANVIKHKVEPKETLYSLSKKYNVTVDDIKMQNEALLKNGLQIGQTLTIKTNN